MRIQILPILILALACQNPASDSPVEIASVHSANNDKPIKTMSEKSIYDQNYSIKSIDGQDFDLAQLKGKRLLIVNTASFCGYTPQYEQLQELYKEYGGDEFAIIGFPANNFGKQEPHDNETIKEFCSKNYGVEFMMMEKISVSGKDIHPLYKWLTSKDENGLKDAPVKWNFQKFLIDEQGKLVEVYGSSTSPLDESIIAFAKG